MLVGGWGDEQVRQAGTAVGVWNRGAGSHKGQLARTGQTQDLTSLYCHSPLGG
jgi:hypothetical protein